MNEYKALIYIEFVLRGMHDSITAKPNLELLAIFDKIRQAAHDSIGHTTTTPSYWEDLCT